MEIDENNVKEKKKSLNISVKSFLTTIIVIFVLMLISYILTLVIPSGEYPRIDDGNGNMIIDEAGEFSKCSGNLPFWKWLLSPFLVLGADGNTTLIAVIIFLLVIGGIFACLEESGLMSYMLKKITFKFKDKRRTLLCVLILFFMAMGALIGSFEEVVPLVPIVVAVSIALGYDSVVGVATSLLAVGCGFATGVCNPFTTGVAQNLAGLPMFSGIWLRLIAFVLIYGLLVLFVLLYAKRIGKPVSEVTTDYTYDKKMDHSLIAFASILGTGIILVLLSGVIKALQDYTLIIVAIMFLAAGLTASIMAGLKGKKLFKEFLSGLVGILPAVIMILMASSIKYTLEEAKVIDTILYNCTKIAKNLPTWTIILFIYLIALVVNFFIPSGSAEAFVLIPILVPLASQFNISAQLVVVAYCFGDGFSNVFYPTNPALLLSLSLADTSYSKWVKWSFKFQLANLVLTSGILLLGYFVAY